MAAAEEVADAAAHAHARDERDAPQQQGAAAGQAVGAAAQATPVGEICLREADDERAQRLVRHVGHGQGEGAQGPSAPAVDRAQRIERAE